MRDEDAISIAKQHLSALLADQNIGSIRLEEIERKGGGGWIITLSFLRDGDPGTVGALKDRLPPDWMRDFKVVGIDERGELLSLTNIRRVTA